VDTNLIWFEADPDLGTASEIAEALTQQGVFVFATGRQTLRACTHLDVSAAQAEQAAEVIRRSVPRLTPVAG
jgi:threonine aldolase